MFYVHTWFTKQAGFGTAVTFLLPGSLMPFQAFQGPMGVQGLTKQVRMPSNSQIRVADLHIQVNGSVESPWTIQREWSISPLYSGKLRSTKHYPRLFGPEFQVRNRNKPRITLPA